MIQDHPAQTGIASVLKVFHCSGDIVGRIESHFFTGCDDQDLLGISLADRSRKASADHISQNIIEHDIRFPGLKETQILQELEGRDNASSCASKPGCGSARLDTEDPSETDF